MCEQMLWREYIFEGMLLGSTIGALLWIIFRPIRKRRERERTHRLTEAAKANLHGQIQIRDKKQPHRRGRRWRIRPPKDPGYYNAR